MIKRQKGGMIKQFKLNGRFVVVIGVSHSKAISKETLHKILSFMEQFQKTCILVEEDAKLSQKTIMNKTNFNEPTTELIVKTLKQIEKKCINGWDIRPSILGTKQNGLYGKNNQGKPHFVTHTLGQIFKEYINKSGNPHKYNKLLQLKTQIPQNIWETKSLHNLIKDGEFKLKYITELMNSLREDFKNIADQYILKIIKNCKNKHLIIICGDKHYDNLIKIL